MKKNLLIFLRVIFILLAMLLVTYFGLKFYYVSESKHGVEKALIVGESPIIGDTKNPLTIVEFFDYRCPHCLVFSKILMEAVGDDVNSGTKILLRPTVVVDQQSYQIAKFVMALDTQKQGETIALHKEIMNLADVPTYDTVKAMAQARGLNVEQAEKDSENFKDIIGTNTTLAQEIGFPSVPALIIGDKGYLPAHMPGVNELRLMMIDAKTRLQPPTK
jgi:protein-disulfide isomerase